MPGSTVKSICIAIRCLQGEFMKNLQRSLLRPFLARQAEEEVFRVQVAESAHPVDRMVRITIIPEGPDNKPLAGGL